MTSAAQVALVVLAGFVFFTIFMVHKFPKPIEAFINGIRKAKVGLAEAEVDSRLPQAAQQGEGAAVTPEKLLELPSSTAAEFVDDIRRRMSTEYVMSKEKELQDDLTERHLSPEQRLTLLSTTSAFSMVAALWERAYGEIFGSQLGLLEQLNTLLSVSMEEAREEFEIAVAASPAVHAGRTFEVWLGFLSYYKLIETVDDTIRITVAGRDFLRHLITTGRALHKPG